jgi:primosomal protein N' (replication factor Y)
MYCYEIWVKSPQYHGKSPLTYTSVTKLLPGTVVRIDLRKRPVMGIVRREAPAPKGVAMKPIDEILFNGDYTLPPESLKLLHWILLYYPAPSGTVAQLFLPSSWPKLTISTVEDASSQSLLKLPKLTAEQSYVLKTIKARQGSFLLHGETGSGKTRVYIELIREVLKNNKSSLVLVPEIGLVPHLQAEIKQVFSNTSIKVFHSGLTPNQRKLTWSEILTSEQPLIVIGPRSALFAPLKNIGLVIVDECHDDGYKQDSTPYYHGLRVASKLAQLHSANLIFGSATPSINDTYIANEKQIPILRMEKTAKLKSGNETKTIIINKLDKSEFTRSKILSTSLINEIQSQLKQNQQTLLFLNRRGSAKVVNCDNCGWRAMCPNCDLPLTFHEDVFTVRCHTCGFTDKAPLHCSDCNNPEIIFYGPGTKSVEKEVSKLFPDAKIARFDGDNLTSERLDKNLSKIHSGEIDIIIGTQILVKGFDIPRLGLTGIIDADSSLSFPDYATEEKTYQLITQAIGRVGRGHVPGVIVLQSFQPDSKLLKQAINKDWGSYYSDQLKQRKIHNFPPYTFLLKLECSRKRRESASKAAEKLKSTLLTKYTSKITILGPTPAFKEKRSTEFVWQLIIKSPRRSVLLDIINNLPSGWHHDIDPTHLL